MEYIFPHEYDAAGAFCDDVEDFIAMTQAGTPARNIRIAVATQNFRSITKHAGKCCHFVLFESDGSSAVREVDRLQLPRELSIHTFSGVGPHPLDAVRTLIVGGAGPAFVRRMAARGIETVTTSEPDPACAVSLYVAGRLPDASANASKHTNRASEEAVEFLKAMANEARLSTLCALLLREQSVSELERTLHMKQSKVSQQLARLRRAGLVAARPCGTTMFYSLASPQVRVIVGAVYEAHCERSAKPERPGTLSSSTLTRPERSR